MKPPARSSAKAFLLLWTAAGLSIVSAAPEKGEEFFEKEVRPILVKRCYDCHSEKSGKRKGGLWLDRREGWQIGGDNGAAIVPGKVDKSLVIHATAYLDEDLQMPPKRKLSSEEFHVLERWVKMGAPDPRNEKMVASVRREAIDYSKARQIWAFRPHSQPEPPAVKDTTWGRDVIDSFILARLEEEQVRPAADAKAEDLLRRLFFDLTGLPPTPEDVAGFVADPSQRTLEQLVDDLLSRPAFGEKWGRHWLDVARYSDSNGGDRNYTFFQAWRYRNYVIDSFNNDRSFYQFVRQQLAGDLLPAKNDAQRQEQLVASTFLSLGPKMLTERDKEKLKLDTADEQIDTVGRAFLGLALGCARCHDHKFDPVSQEDYYALAGIFRSTQVVMGTRNGCVNVASWVEQPLPLAEPGRTELKAKIERLELTMRLVIEKQFMNKAGGKMTLDKLPLAGVIYDESDAELIGDWKKSEHSINRFGTSYIHDDRKGKGKKQVIFRGSLPESGIYEVRVAYNANADRAKNVPIKVEAQNEVYELTLDQTQPPTVGGLFQAIGRFRFEKGGRVNVIFETGGTEGYVIVDAVQFVAEVDIEREAQAFAALKGEGGEMLFRMSEGDLKKELSKMIKELRDADLAMAPRDARDAGDIHLRVRGEVNQLGPVIRRNFPRILYDGPAPEIPDGKSGRLALAKWITGPEDALLDRVMVNRIWHHLFNRGIVASVDNFGALGSGPTHPELLDYLASEFRDGNGSVKKLVRRIVLSRTYQLSADASRQALQADPDNQLYSHQNHRRLTAEEIRDGALFLAGRLETIQADGTAMKYGEDLDKPMSFAKDTLRTVYLPVARNNLVAELETFDAANPDLVSGKRPLTTVPTQALFLLNGEFFVSQAKEIARAISNREADPEMIVAGLYRKILNRPPLADETARALVFIDEISGGEKSGPKREEAYDHFAHLLLISTEFLFLN